MQKLTEAEEFHNGQTDKGKLHFDDYNHIQLSEVYKFTESYHQYEVNAISDEEISDKISEIARAVEFPLNSPRSHLRLVQRRFKEWFKNKLLKQ